MELLAVSNAIARALLLATAIAYAVTPAHAQSCGPSIAGSPCATGQSAGMDSTGGVGQAAGNPINVITGNKYQQEADMPALPGVLGLELVRHYNSRLAASGMPLQGIGHGWQFSYDTRLHIIGSTLQIIQADGARIIFARSAWSKTLCTTSDPAQGVVRTLRSGEQPEYRWLWPNGRELSFDHNGRLVRINDSSGMAVGIERLADGRISVVTDPQGRSMTFHYLHRKDDRPGRYRGVQSVDTPVGRVSYDYGDDPAGGDPVRNANLSAVHLPTHYDPSQPRPAFRLGDTPTSSSISNLKRNYHYEDSRFPTLLTGVTIDGAGSDGKPMRERIATWAYDSNALAMQSTRFESGRSADIGKPYTAKLAEQLTFDRSAPGQTRITDGNGRVTTYRHAIVAGAFRLLEARGAGCASCGPVNVRYRYDSHGRVEEVIALDQAGMPTEGRRTKLDALGRAYALQRVSYRMGKPAAVALVVRQQFTFPGLPSTWSRSGGAPGHFGPRRIAADSVVPGNTHAITIEYNQRQQPVMLSETGYDPVTGSASTRITRYRYEEISGRSLLVEIDGPLPNGPAGTPADSDITRYEWDDRGAFVTRVRQAMGPTLDIARDAHTGRPTSVRYRWDDIVRTSRYDYGSNGQISRHHETAYADDGATVLAERETGVLANARNEVSSITWPDGSVEEVMRRWSERRTASGRRPVDASLPAADMSDVLRYDIDGKSAERIIDDFGQVVGIRNPGQGWQHATYDEAGRISTISDARGMVTKASHDAAGRLLAITRALPGDRFPERVEFAWHGPYRTSETVQTDHKQAHATHYVHTPWGQVARMRVEIASANGDNAPVSLTLQSTYDASGRLSARALPGGERLAYRYYVPTPYHGQRAAIERIHWLRWLDWLMTRVPETWLDASGFKTRLVEFAPQEDASGAGASFVQVDPQPQAPQAEPGMSKEAPGQQHDAAGLPQRIDTSKGSFALRWNAASQLVSVRSADAGSSGDIASYTYDAHGRRASKRSANGAEYYLYEGTQLVAIESRPLHGSPAVSQYLYEGYRPVVWLREGIALLLQTDRRGAVSAVTSAEPDASARKTLWRGDSGAWGRSPITDAVASRYDPRLRLVNQLADEETGLSYHIARYYDPASGRFISPDPAGIADTLDSDVPEALRLDLTAYAAGQPNWYFDPDGAARLVYYAIATGADGKQLGVEKSNFTKARWAFSVDGIEASGDGGSDAINRLMEKYAKNQTGLLYDKDGNFIDGKKSAVSWNGTTDETVGSFTAHYRANLISMRQFVIADYSNRDAALLIANLIKDKDGENLCKDTPGLMPQIHFGAGQDSIVVTRSKGVDPNSPANLQRIVNCNVNKETSLPIVYADDTERERVERIEAAAEMNESSALNKDCSRDGCPGVTISGQPGENGEPARQYHASYGRSQFVASTFIETLDNLPPDDKIAIGLNSDLQRRIKLARARAVSINGGKGLFDFARKFSCANASFVWDHAGEIGALTVEERASFQSKSSLDRQNFIDMVCFIPSGNSKPTGEARNAFMTESIFSDAILKTWLMSLYKSYDAFNLTSRIFIRNNLRKVLDSSALAERLKNREPKETTNEKEKYQFEKRQREIEVELGMRTARLHNGGGGGLTGDMGSLTRTCVPGEKIPCDTGDYVKTFIGIKNGRGDWRSLRCGDIGTRRGIQILPLKI